MEFTIEKVKSPRFLAIALTLALVLWGGWRVLKSSTEQSSHRSRSDQNSENKSSVPHQKRSLAQENQSASSISHNHRDSSVIPMTIEGFQRKYPGWRIRRRSDGSIQHLAGGLIPGAGKNARSIQKLANELSPLFAQGDYSLESTPRMVASSPRMRSYHLNQYAHGYEVYQGSMQMMARASDDAVYLVNNRLKDITNFERAPVVSLEAATAVIQDRYPTAKFISLPHRPKVFAVNDQRSQLAWHYEIELKAPRISHRHVLVSAVDGLLLYEEERAIHD